MNIPIDVGTVLTTLMTFVAGGGLAGWWLQWRKDRREARAQEKKEVADDVDLVLNLRTQVTDLTEKYVAILNNQTDLHGQVHAARTDAAAARRLFDDLRAALVGALRDLRALLRWAAQHHDVVGPPPEVSDGTRQLLEEYPETDHAEPRP